jgi:16S rRNA (uracil1498-N3)-methyltransferase
MSARFFSSAPILSETVTLDGPEAHHLLHVMRAGVGMQVVLFDGSGAEFDARITHTGRSDVQLQVVARREVDRESRIALTLGVALPKGDRQKWLVEKATELGVARLVPLATERGLAQPESSTLEKLRRVVIEASKQCGRNRLMAIEPSISLAAFVAGADESASRLIAHPGGQILSGILSANASATIITAAIGPEGGFTDEELNAALAAGWTPIDLGPRILRVETAAIALSALISSRA